MEVPEVTFIGVEASEDKGASTNTIKFLSKLPTWEIKFPFETVIIIMTLTLTVIASKVLVSSGRHTLI